MDSARALDQATGRSKMTKTYATKQERFSAMKAEASKVERAALGYIDDGLHIVGDDLWKKANELWAAANAYSIRWNVA